MASGLPGHFDSTTVTLSALIDGSVPRGPRDEVPSLSDVLRCSTARHVMFAENVARFRPIQLRLRRRTAWFLTTLGSGPHRRSQRCANTTLTSRTSGAAIVGASIPENPMPRTTIARGSIGREGMNENPVAWMNMQLTAYAVNRILRPRGVVC